MQENETPTLWVIGGLIGILTATYGRRTIDRGFSLGEWYGLLLHAIALFNGMPEAVRESLLQQDKEELDTTSKFSHSGESFHITYHQKPCYNDWTNTAIVVKSAHKQVGQPMPNPTVNELDAVLKPYRGGTIIFPEDFNNLVGHACTVDGTKLTLYAFFAGEIHPCGALNRSERGSIYRANS